MTKRPGTYLLKKCPVIPFDQETGNISVKRAISKPSATLGGTITTSTIPLFSDKLMMHCIYILNDFGLIGAGAGAFFTLGNDLSMKAIMVSKDIFFYSQEGIEIKIKNGWFEEPPQMEDRAAIIKKGN
ncbi:DUF3231 family protein [Mesobacillus selenatarsenatis]|nr:DUF3231 family protein [Mesobacillus selenatarsenatis]